MSKKLKNAIGITYLTGLILSFGIMLFPEQYGKWIGRFMRGVGIPWFDELVETPNEKKEEDDD